MPPPTRRPEYDQSLLPPPEAALSMFHRRVLVLGSAMVLVLLGLGMQLARLSVFEGEERLERVERRLDRVELQPTLRGRILDRAGRVLARDESSDDLAASFPLISGTWAVEQAASAARRDLGRAGWSALPSAQRREAIIERLPEWDAQAAAIWAEVARLGGIDRADLEARLDRIRSEVARQVVAVADRREAIERQRLAEGGDGAPPPQGPIREQRSLHVVISELSPEQAIELRRLAERVDGAIEVRPTVRRVHPWRDIEVEVDGGALPSPIRFEPPRTITVRGVTDLLLGEVREQVWAEDLRRRPLRGADGRIDLGGYLADGDRVGRRGIEGAFEDRLRGRRGMVRRNIDSGELERVEPVWGDDIELSVDIALQARIAALFDPAVGLALPQQWHAGWLRGEPRPLPLPAEWGPLQGAVVVLEVESGEILAAVSAPSPHEAAALSAPWRQALATPLVHRALEGVYPPGSIIKPIVYLAAVAAGVHPADGAIECTGHYFPNLDGVARCWIYRERYGLLTHSMQTGGPLSIEEALARSCNIYFYRLADRLGPAGTIEWYRRFGLGGALGVGLGWRSEGAGDATPAGEHGGFLPTAAAIESIRRGGDRVTPVLLGIGQGQVTWTPLQAANAFAIMARGGEVKDPTLLRHSSDRAAQSRLPLTNDSVRRALAGLRQAVADPAGTGHHLTLEDGRRERLLDLPGLVVWGKTGTAQAPPIRIDRGELEERLESLEHAWFVGLVGEGDDPAQATPRYAVAVILENAGSGGRAAGPMGAAVIRALIDEGHLEPRRNAAPGSAGERRGGAG